VKLFNVAGWNTKTKEGFEAMNWALREREAGMATAKGAGNQLQRLMMDAGLDSEQSLGRFREVVEGIGRDLDRELERLGKMPTQAEAVLSEGTMRVPPQAERGIPSVVQRYEEPGLGRASMNRPQGIYTSRADVTSPHANLGGKQFFWKANPEANVLRLDLTEADEAAAAMREGAIGAGSGVHLVRHLLGDSEFARLRNLPQQQLLEEARKLGAAGPGTNFFDQQDIIEAIGGTVAKKRGYDATYITRPYDPAFDEMVLLTKKAGEPLVNTMTRTPAEQAVYDFVRPTLDGIRQEMERYGLPHARLDDAVEYMHRQATRRVKSGTSGYKLYPTAGAEDIAREPIWKNWKGGTADIQRAALAARPIVEAGGDAAAVQAELARLLAIPKAQGGISNIPDIGKVSEALADMSPETLSSGLFGNYGVFDFEAGMASEMDKLTSAKAIVKALGRPAVLKPAANIAKDESVSLGKLAHKLGLENPVLDAAGNKIGDSKFYERLAEEAGLIQPGQVLDEAAVKAMRKDYRVEKTLAEDLGRVMQSFGKTPDAMKEPLAFYDSLQNVWKALQTGPWPAFQVRNRLSGFVQEALAGRTALKYQAPMRALIRGESSAIWKEHPLVQKLAGEWGLNAAKLTDQEASDLARALLRQYSVVVPYQGEALQRVGQAGSAVSTGPEDFLREFTGGGIGGKTQGITAERIAREYTKNPFGKIRGVFGATESTSGPIKGGEMWGARVEAMNRGPGFFALTAKGVDPVEAARQIGTAQVRYENRFYTPFEQAMLRVFPFGKFLRGQTEYVAKELLGRPAGPMGTAIRATSRMRGEEITPEYVQQTASVPVPEGTPLIGPQRGGDLRYLTGFGLMHEDPLQLVGGGLKGGLRELLSRMSPGVKGPIEWASGRSFFQAGPEGGRELTDMDPTLGRIASNVEQLVTGERGRVKAKKLPLWIEQSAANSPFSRFLTTTRTLTDPRKAVSDDVPIPGPAAAMNLLTGARVVDVPEAAQEAILRESITSRLRDSGVAKVFERTYVPKETLESLPPDQQQEAMQLQALMNILADRSKKRARGEPLGPIGGNPLLNQARGW
jgi:hypothetical protein